jgi:TolC family type I secretion outer membrane protein
MNKQKIIFGLSVLLAAHLFPAHAAGTNSTGWLTRPLSLTDALNTTLAQNASILKAKNDLEAQQGLVVQTRAVALPQLTASGQYKITDANYVENFGAFAQPDQNWNAGIQISQSIYMGGRMVAAIRAADATKLQALADFRTSVADALLQVRLAYYDVLLAQQQVAVHEASVKLLEKERDDQQHRYDAGTVPHFNVLRAEVSVANERPNLIAAHNTLRIAKNNLVNDMGYDLPREIWEDIPLNLTDTLATAPWEVNLPDAIQQALTQRSELVSLKKNVELQKLNIVNAKSGYKPSVDVFAGYGWHNAQFTPPLDLDHDIRGWNAGAQLNWNIFDGLLTHGKVLQAKALYDKSKTQLADESRQIELAVRTAYSEFVQARETLESQGKVVELAEESLREANARTDAGTGTQLDVLDAETSLTQSRTTQVQAQHDYLAARAKLERAIGADLAPVK